MQIAPRRPAFSRWTRLPKLPAHQRPAVAGLHCQAASPVAAAYQKSERNWASWASTSFHAPAAAGGCGLLWHSCPKSASTAAGDSACRHRAHGDCRGGGAVPTAALWCRPPCRRTRKEAKLPHQAPAEDRKKISEMECARRGAPSQWGGPCACPPPYPAPPRQPTHLRMCVSSCPLSPSSIWCSRDTCSAWSPGNTPARAGHARRGSTVAWPQHRAGAPAHTISCLWEAGMATPARLQTARLGSSPPGRHR